jgi:hypothetical protein
MTVANVFVHIAPATVSNILGMKPLTFSTVLRNGDTRRRVESVAAYTRVWVHGI